MDALELKPSRPDFIEPRKIYLCKMFNFYHRIEINAFDNDNKQNLCHCLFIDVGSDGWHKRDIIYNCPEEFQSIPRFAVKCSLFRLEDFHENVAAKKYLNFYLRDRIIQAVIRTAGEDYIEQLDSGNSNIPIEVIFFKTDPNGVQINLNQLILEKTCASIQPAQLNPNEINIVRISYVSPFDGSVYCHTKESIVNLQFIEKVINRLAGIGISSLFSHVLPSDIKCNGDVYLAYDRDDKRWYRVKVLMADGKVDNQMSTRSASCFFVDYGMTKKISFHNIFTLTGVLSKYPHQVLLTRLSNVKMTSANIEKAREMLQAPDIVTMNLVGTDTCSIPRALVTIKKWIFKHNGTELCLINDMFAEK